MKIFLWRIGSGTKFRISELSDGNISLEDWFWSVNFQMEIFLWRIGTGMKFRISELSDGNISLEDGLHNQQAVILKLIPFLISCQSCI